MLTSFDSKWINTLYMDKILQYENIIQAFLELIVYLVTKSHSVQFVIIENLIQWNEI